MSATKEAIERLLSVTLANQQNYVMVKREDLATLLASHDKLVEGLRQAQSVLAEFRDPDMTIPAANVFTRVVAAELACRTALGETP